MMKRWLPPESRHFNWDNPAVHEDFLTTLRFWCDRGADGFRIDVAAGKIGRAHV